MGWLVWCVHQVIAKSLLDWMSASVLFIGYLGVCDAPGSWLMRGFHLFMGTSPLGMIFTHNRV
jgi:hypothetical protein